MEKGECSFGWWQSQTKGWGSNALHGAQVGIPARFRHSDRPEWDLADSKGSNGDCSGLGQCGPTRA